MNLSDFRTKHPEYDDLTDYQLATGLHKQYYSDMDMGDFLKQIEYDPPGEMAQVHGQDVKPTFATDNIPAAPVPEDRTPDEIPAQPMTADRMQDDIPFQRSEAAQESQRLLERARGITGKPDMGDQSGALAYAPLGVTAATKGLMDFLLLPAMEAVGLPKIGVDTRKTLDTALEYWSKKASPGPNLPDIGVYMDEEGIDFTTRRPLRDMFTETSQLMGAMGPISGALKAGGLVADN